MPVLLRHTYEILSPVLFQQSLYFLPLIHRIFYLLVYIQFISLVPRLSPSQMQVAFAPVLCDLWVQRSTCIREGELEPGDKTNNSHTAAIDKPSHLLPDETQHCSCTATFASSHHATQFPAWKIKHDIACTCTYRSASLH